MKFIIGTVFAMFATAAMATDLPNLTPIVPYPGVVSYGTSITVFGDAAFNPDEITDYTGAVGGLSIEQDIWNGVFVGGMVVTDFDQKHRLEGTVGAKVPVLDNLNVKASASVGREWDGGDLTDYYAFRVGGSVKLSNQITWNVASYEWRDSFDGSDDYEQQTIGTGVTYSLDDRQDISLNVYRSFDEDFNATSNGIKLGYTFKF
jgi:hypothetical protein